MFERILHNLFKLIIFVKLIFQIPIIKIIIKNKIIVLNIITG